VRTSMSLSLSSSLLLPSCFYTLPTSSSSSSSASSFSLFYSARCPSPISFSIHPPTPYSHSPHPPRVFIPDSPLLSTPLPRLYSHLLSFHPLVGTLLLSSRFLSLAFQHKQ